MFFRYGHIYFVSKNVIIMVMKEKQINRLFIALIIAILFFVGAVTILTPIQSLLVGVLALLVTLWTNEALPLGVVSLLPILLFPLFGILGVKETTINYANPIIFLFFGGFLIAIAVEKTLLHSYIAKKILKIFPSTIRGAIFGLMISSALLSSVLSNTATTLLLIPIALFLTQDIKIKARFALSIAYGSSIGGILTPIGTPPNLILLGFMQDKALNSIAFIDWVIYIAPLVILMLLFSAYLLSLGTKDIEFLFHQSQDVLDKEQKKVLYLVMVLVFILVFNQYFGFNENIVILFFGLLLFLPPLNLLNWDEDRAKIPYEIMFLFGAGFSLASAFSSTSLDAQVASYLTSMSGFSSFVFLLSVATLVTFATEITSNTALTSIMLPVVYMVSKQMGIEPTLFLFVATICSSYAFMLPIATAPNAIAMSSGVLSVKDMAYYGFFINIVGIALVVFMAEFFWKF